MKRTVPSRHTLSGLVPGPGERIDPQLPHWMNGNQVSNLCQLLDSLSWILDEKNHVQDLAGISGNDYTEMYKLFLGDKMDTSIFPDSPPIKLPQASKRRKWRNFSVSSYRSSLRSLRTLGNAHPQVDQGSTSKRHRPKRHTRTRNTPKIRG